jgi:hypothetical protein
MIKIKMNKKIDFCYQSQYLITLSHPQETILLGSIGCHATPIQIPSWALKVLKFLVDFQSQTNTFNRIKKN